MRRRAPLLLALLLPIACAAPDPADPAEVLRDALATHQASITGVTGAPPPATGPAAPQAAAPRAAPPRQGGDGTPPSQAGELIGQAPEAITRWLGEPRLRRAEGPAEVWHYQSAQCHLDIVLYPEEGASRSLRVAFAAARAVGTARRGEAACLRDIARGATVRPAPGLPDRAETG
jgi:hypothetical protein